MQLNLPEVEDQSATGADETVDAVISDLPVLYPEGGEEEEAEEYPDEDAVAAAMAKAEAVKELPELQPVAEEPEEEAEDELLVNEWPDPVA